MEEEEENVISTAFSHPIRDSLAPSLSAVIAPADSASLPLGICYVSLSVCVGPANTLRITLASVRIE